MICQIRQTFPLHGSCLLLMCILCCTFIHINSGTQHPALKELYRHVKKLIAEKWFDVGVELFEEDDLKQLSTIKSSNNGNAESCCAEMLTLWHEKYPKATWNDLIGSLNAPGVELRERASRIEGMLLPPGKLFMYITNYFY